MHAGGVERFCHGRDETSPLNTVVNPLFSVGPLHSLAGVGWGGMWLGWVGWGRELGWVGLPWGGAGRDGGGVDWIGVG